MRRISSGVTFAYKRIFPVVWFGFLLVFIGIGVVNGQIFPFVIGPIAMMVFGYFLMQKLVFDLVDEVWVDSDELVVKNRGQEQRIALADIKNVNYSPFISPPRVTLLLRRPTVFGDPVFRKPSHCRSDRARRPRAPALRRGRIAQNQLMPDCFGHSRIVIASSRQATTQSMIYNRYGLRRFARNDGPGLT